jgi:hypothetical protein
MRLAIKHLLASHPSTSLPRSCACGKTSTSTPYFHFHCCKQAGSLGRITRHDIVLNTLANLASIAGFATRIEPRKFVGDARLKPDLMLTSPSHSLLVDVQVTHPCRSSIIKSSRTSPLAAASEREIIKINTYTDFATASSRTFVPFVLEAHGAWGKGASDLIDILARHASEYDSSISPKMFSSMATRRISIALQEGNAKLIREACVKLKDFLPVRNLRSNSRIANPQDVHLDF